MLYEDAVRRGSGLCLFGAEKNAIFFCTAVLAPFDTRWGKAMAGHSAYVRPEYRRKGWATRLRQRAVEILKNAGYDTLLGGAYHSNDLEAEIVKQFGYKPYHTSGSVSLREK
jgi:GNAT superfamily N-acetyltransferase